MIPYNASKNTIECTSNPNGVGQPSIDVGNNLLVNLYICEEDKI